MEQGLDLPTLIGQAKVGDFRALKMLYNRYAPPIRRYCYQRLNSHGRAEQCVQATFVNAWHNISAFEYQSDSLFAAWLYTIASNALAQQQRQDIMTSWGQPLQSRQHRLAVEIQQVHDQQTTLAQALSFLSVEQQHVITLKFFAGLSNREIATAINRSEGAVKTIQHHAIHQLHQLTR